MSEDAQKIFFHYEIKAIIIGNSEVGKTAFLNRFFNNKFTYDHLTTLGFNYISKTFELSNGEKIKISFTDTAGQERFRSLTPLSLRKVQGIILLYDITNKNSFESVNYWLKMIKDQLGEKLVPIILIGNKIDLQNERKISNEKGEEKAKELNLHFYESSVKDNINVKESVNDLINQIIPIIKNNQNDDNNKGFKIVFDKKKGKKKKKCKC